MEPPDRTPVLLIVNGLPASGKTTLARRLADDLSLPAFCKNDFKDRESADEVEAALRAGHSPMELGGTLIEVGIELPYEEVLDRVRRAL